MTFLSVHLTAVALALLTMLAAVLLLQDRRTPQSTLAWLLAMVAIPYVAAPLFLALGGRKFVHRRPTRAAGGLPTEPGMAGTFVALGAEPARDGNRTVLLDDPVVAFRAVMELVEAAETTIDAEFYIVANDDEGRAFVEALTERAKAGLRVRLLIDRLGTLRPPRAELARLVEAGGTWLWFAPLFRRFPRARLNLRNHRKSLIADGARLFTGGMNIAGDYIDAGTGSAAPFDDLGMLVEGPVVADFVGLFEADWKQSGGEPAEPAALPEPAGPQRAQLIASGPDRPLDSLHLGLVDAIHRADRRVWISTPYFLPTEVLATALATAARRGLDVRLLVPAKSNHPTADFARGAYLRGLQAEGCRILLYPRMLHAKAGIIDETAWVGTANFDVRSLLLNLETALMLYDTTGLTAAETWFETRISYTTEGVKRPRLLRRLGEGLFRLGAPLL